jgi:hypothetical protein
MPGFISNPIAYGVRSDPNDQAGGPLDQELVAGAGITLTTIEVPPGSGNLKIRISGTGGSSNTYTSTVDPTPQNDSVDTAGLGRVFEIANYWYNTARDILYVCEDDAPNAAVWVVVDTKQYRQSILADNTTTDIDLGSKADYVAHFLDYRLFNATGNIARVGKMYIGHNEITADLRDEFVEINGALPITASVHIDGSNHIILRFLVGTLGSTCTFRYYESFLG